MMLKSIPLLAAVLIIYNLIAFITPATLTGTVIDTGLVSGAQWIFSVNDLLLFLAIILLYIEIIKSTQTSTSSIVDHVLSMLVFIVFLMEFILVPQVGNSTFFLIMLISFIDVIAGFTITISTARRDITMDRQMIR
ncbi:MAG: hypothetical protein C4548_09110 [Desulfobacteraceae bacterium]|nr:MAG: hypothetical protein C4548_09110 [Desulfobacteraceae bacterium]